MGLGSWWMARSYDRFMAESEQACLARWRAELLGGLAGEVLEVGAGTGLNLPHYPATVTRLVATEPNRDMRGKLQARVARGEELGPVVPEVRADDAGLAAVPDASFDAVVATLVLCSVPDPARSLAAIRRVLRPGGAYVFLEHVAAEGDPGRLRWQRWVEPVWKRMAGNCHLTRRSGALIEQAGFSLERIERESMRKAMPIVRPTVRGIARAPG